MADNFIARLAQANVAPKSGIADFVKKTDVDDKLKKLNKKVTSNETKHVLVEKKLHELSKKFKLLSAKDNVFSRWNVFYKR